jgi:hypothetical protein
LRAVDSKRKTKNDHTKENDFESDGEEFTLCVFEFSVTFEKEGVFFSSSFFLFSHLFFTINRIRQFSFYFSNIEKCLFDADIFVLK